MCPLRQTSFVALRTVCGQSSMPASPRQIDVTNGIPMVSRILAKTSAVAPEAADTATAVRASHEKPLVVNARCEESRLSSLRWFEQLKPGKHQLQHDAYD